MKISFSSALLKWFYHSAVSSQLKKEGFPEDTAKNINEEYKKIAQRAKDIGNSKLISAYVMGIYFIAMNRVTGKTAEENYEIFKKGLLASKMFHKVMGNGDAYLDPKKMPGRLAWSKQSHQHEYANDWVVDILPGNEKYDLGYDYSECGIVKAVCSRRVSTIGKISLQAGFCTCRNDGYESGAYNDLG